VPKVQEALQKFISPENILNAEFNSYIANTMLNPIYKTINTLASEVSRFRQILFTLQIKNNKDISQEDLIDRYFNGNVKRYKQSLDSINEIENIINKELLPNINMYISIDENIELKDITNTINLLKKYGLDFHSFTEYMHKLQYYLNKASLLKNSLFAVKKEEYLEIIEEEFCGKTTQKQLSISEYKKEIKKLVKEYIKSSYVKTDYFDINKKLNIVTNKRPVSKLLNSIDIESIYFFGKTNSLLIDFIENFNLKKTSQFLNTFFLEKCLKEHSKLFSMSPETFAKTLFIYDWIKFANNDHQYKTKYKSQISKIIYLQSKYSPLKKTIKSNRPIKAKTLENNLNHLKSFIAFLNKYSPKKRL